MKSGTDILQRIINTGGLMGAAAKMYSCDREKTDQFIRECYEQCHNQSAKYIWGDKLVGDIILYTETKQIPENSQQN